MVIVLTVIALACSEASVSCLIASIQIPVSLKFLSFRDSLSKASLTFLIHTSGIVIFM